MAGDNDPLKNQENGQIASNGNGHLAEPLDDTESDNENSGDENERSGYELLPQNDIPHQGDDSEDDSPQTLDEILRQIPPSHTSPQVQDMIEESQRHQDRELIQERDSLFSQPQATQTSTVFDSSEEVFKEILMFQITKYGKKTTLFITTCGAVAFFSNIFGKF